MEQIGRAVEVGRFMRAAARQPRLAASVIRPELLRRFQERIWLAAKRRAREPADRNRIQNATE